MFRARVCGGKKLYAQMHVCCAIIQCIVRQALIPRFALYVCRLRQRNTSPLKPQSRPSVIRSARPASITELAAWSSLAVPLLHQLTNAIQCGGEWICTAIVIHPKVYLPIREALKIIEGLAVCVQGKRHVGTA